MTREEIAALYPFAVDRAQHLKDVFGDGVRILKATQEGSPDLVSAAHHVTPVPAEPPSFAKPRRHKSKE